MNKAVKAYMAELGRRGGKKSKRTLSTAQALEMVAAKRRKALGLKEPNLEPVKSTGQN